MLQIVLQQPDVNLCLQLCFFLFKMPKEQEFAQARHLLDLLHLLYLKKQFLDVGIAA